jgi:hypothetical protein
MDTNTINITSRSREPLRLISNLAHTPFELDGNDYASVEGFWQGLRYADDSRRREIALLAGVEAWTARKGQDGGDELVYDGAVIRVGSPDHWLLMERACRAKFTQDGRAREALLGTGEHQLTHRMRRDSRTIPGAVMAGIWMRIRDQLREMR